MKILSISFARYEMSFKTDSISKSKKREVAKGKTKKSQIPFNQFDPKHHNLLKKIYLSFCTFAWSFGYNFLEFSPEMINHYKFWLTSARPKHFFFKIILPLLARNTNIYKLVNVNVQDKTNLIFHLWSRQAGGQEEENFWTKFLTN